MSCALLAVLVVIAKLPTLTTPAYWDEMAWLRQAEWLSNESLHRALPGLRPDDAFWGHPPGLHLTLAVLYKVFGHSLGLAHLLILGFAVLGVCSTFLLARLLYDTATARLAALLLAVAPIYFAQSGMFLADVPVAALGVTCAYLALTGRFLPYLALASYMVLVKETSTALIVALVVYLYLDAKPATRPQLVSTLKYAAPLIVIGAFVALQKVTTGEFFAIYDFEFQLFEPSVAAVTRQFEVVSEWIFFHQFRWVLTALIVVDVAWNGVRLRKDVWLVLLVIVFSGYSFSGLYFLPRYLLPTLPFFFILGAHSVMKLVRRGRVGAGLSTVAVAALLWGAISQPFVGNAEVSMRYRDAVWVDQTMARYIESNHPGAEVSTRWPYDTELTSPLLGYVERPLRTARLDSVGEGRAADLILLSTWSSSRDEMDELADEERWHVITTVQRGPVTAVLYGRGAGS